MNGPLDQRLLGGVEAGGSKFICAAGPAPDRILRETRIDTTTPDRTFSAVIAFFDEIAHDLGPISALGVASFGPVSIRRDRPDWGHILQTPKPGWSGADIAGRLGAALGCPVAIDTDVNGAAMAEHRYGAGRGLDTLAYVTVGSGIGAGILVDGQPIHGMLHPEIGHLKPRRPAADRDAPGLCPFHGDCFEGLASGKAIEARFGASLAQLPHDHPAWAIEADYLAQLCAALVLTASPERIIMGGGVMQQRRLMDLIRGGLDRALGSYPAVLAQSADGQHYIVPPDLGGRAGVTGALLLAAAALT